MRNMTDENGTLRPCIAIDLETRKDERAEDYVKKYKKYQAPSNYKKPEAIKGWIDEARKKDVNKSALYVPTNRIWIACVHDLQDESTYEYASSSEHEVIGNLFHDLDTKWSKHVMFGFNTRSFDYPVMTAAALRCSIHLPIHFRTVGLLSDILDDFYHTKIKLQDIAHLIGTGKLMEGSEVAAEWEAHCIGDTKAQQRVIDYCHQDVAICVDYVKRTYGVAAG